MSEKTYIHAADKETLTEVAKLRAAITAITGKKVSILIMKPGHDTNSGEITYRLEAN